MTPHAPAGAGAAAPEHRFLGGASCATVAAAVADTHNAHPVEQRSWELLALPAAAKAAVAPHAAAAAAAERCRTPASSIRTDGTSCSGSRGSFSVAAGRTKRARRSRAALADPKVLGDLEDVEVQGQDEAQGQAFSATLTSARARTSPPDAGAAAAAAAAWELGGLLLHTKTVQMQRICGCWQSVGGAKWMEVAAAAM
jgi:hypothetical protein